MSCSILIISRGTLWKSVDMYVVMAVGDFSPLSLSLVSGILWNKHTSWQERQSARMLTQSGVLFAARVDSWRVILPRSDFRSIVAVCRDRPTRKIHVCVHDSARSTIPSPFLDWTSTKRSPPGTTTTNCLSAETRSLIYHVQDWSRACFRCSSWSKVGNQTNSTESRSIEDSSLSRDKSDNECYRSAQGQRYHLTRWEWRRTNNHIVWLDIPVFD